MKRKEDIMEKTIREENSIGKADQGKRKWRSLILNFLLFGGWILVVSAVLGIIVLIYA